LDLLIFAAVLCGHTACLLCRTALCRVRLDV
jgi:hypothetical protein